MADVILCYASQDEAVAGRLASAVARLGYSLWSEDDLPAAGSGADITDRVSPAKAAIVIWSEAAAASEWVRAEANFARGQKKLVQASADDRAPPLPFRPAETVSIADWRGDETHPGWRRISAGLEALCGPAPAGKAAASPSPAPAPAGRRRGWLVAGLTMALLAAVALATFVWMRGLAPVARQGQAPSIAASPDPVTPAPAVEPKAAAPTADPPLEQAWPPEPQVSGAEAPTNPAEPPTSRVEAPPPPDRVEPPPPPNTVEPPPARPNGSRINRQNSQNMRLFCQRAGRGTPQCRSFARQLRNERR